MGPTVVLLASFLASHTSAAVTALGNWRKPDNVLVNRLGGKFTLFCVDGEKR